MTTESALIFSLVVNLVVAGGVVALFFYVLFFSPTPRQVREELKQLKQENIQLHEEVSGLRELVAEQSIEIKKLRSGEHHPAGRKHQKNGVSALAEKIKESFDEGELTDFLLQFNLSPEMITGRSFGDKCVGLVTYFNRRGELPQLRAALRIARPKGDW